MGVARAPPISSYIMIVIHKYIVTWCCIVSTKVPILLKEYNGV